MIFKYRKSKTGIYGTFDIDENGNLVDYNLTVPDIVPILPIEVQLTNLHTIYLKNRGLNQLNPIVLISEPEVAYSPISKYDLVKYLTDE